MQLQPALVTLLHQEKEKNTEKSTETLKNTVKFTARAQTENTSGQWEAFHPTPHGITGAAAAKLLQSCPTLCDPIDGSPPGSSVPGILQARTLEWVAISFSNARMHAKALQLCLTLCDPMDSSPPGSSVYRILYARIL